MHKSGPSHAQFKGVGEIGGDFWREFLRSSDGTKRRVLPMEVSQQYLWDLFLSQDRRCAYTREVLTLHPRNTRTASVDRVDNLLGYVEGNVQWVHKEINMMKGQLSDKRFRQLCGAVAGGLCEIKV